tara:strand:+ start:2322 stop:3134 length:813 start_codon:yes stop_codon:yes gene_type:complete
MSIFKNGILVVAHPDDECLFYSSIINKISTIIFCFSKIPGEKYISIGREKALKEFPLKNKNLVNLEIAQAKTNNLPTNWLDIEDNSYGIKGGLEDSSYSSNYFILKSKLNELLTSNTTVITHNPWGEYGNAEHIQIFKIIYNIAKEKNIKMFVDGYYSNLTRFYTKRKQHLLIPKVYSLKTNKRIYSLLRDHYLNNKCWTWFNNYDVPLYESFYKVNLSIDLDSNYKFNRTLDYPLNYIEMRNPIYQYLRDLLKKFLPLRLKKLFRSIRN